jgi:hypothetical protein
VIRNWFAPFPKYLRQSGETFQTQTVIHLKSKSKAGNIPQRFVRIHAVNLLLILLTRQFPQIKTDGLRLTHEVEVRWSLTADGSPLQESNSGAR